MTLADGMRSPTPNPVHLLTPPLTLPPLVRVAVVVSSGAGNAGEDAPPPVDMATLVLRMKFRDDTKTRTPGTRRTLQNICAFVQGIYLSIYVCVYANPFG